MIPRVIQIRKFSYNETDPFPLMVLHHGALMNVVLFAFMFSATVAQAHPGKQKKQEICSLVQRSCWNQPTVPKEPWGICGRDSRHPLPDVSSILEIFGTLASQADISQHPVNPQRGSDILTFNNRSNINNE